MTLTFDQYMTKVTQDTKGKIHGVWGKYGDKKFYILDKTFNLLHEVKAFENNDYTAEVMELVGGNLPKLLVTPKTIDEVKEEFELDYRLSLKAQRMRELNK